VRLRVLPLLLAWGLALAAVLPAAAQSLPDRPPREAAIPLGPTLLYPFFTSTMEQTDNIFQRSENDPSNQSATVTTIIPGFVFLLPFSHSEASLGYAVRYRDYSLEDGSDDGIDPYTHYLRGGVRLVFGSGLVTELRQEFRHGVVDTQTVEGGETRFTGEKQDHTLTELVVALEHGARRWYIGGGTTNDEVVGERKSLIFDVDEERVRVGAELPLRSNLRALWEVRAHQADLDNTLIQRTEEQVEGRAGARWRLGEGSDLDLSAGWIYAQYGLDGEETLSVPFGSAGFERELGTGGRLSARAERNIYPSVELNHPAYVSDKVEATVSNADLARLGLGFRGIFFRNDYRDDTRGKDRTLAGEGWIGYRFGRWFQARGFVYWSKRDSTLPLLDYHSLSGGITLIAGPY
jgi:hypothetical protein